MTQNKNIVAQRISELLKIKSMTQSILAKESGITPAAISQIINAERFPSTPVLIKIAKVLTVSIDYLVGQIEFPNITMIINNDNELSKFLSNFLSLNPKMQDLIKKQVEFLKKQKWHMSLLTQLHFKFRWDIFESGGRYGTEWTWKHTCNAHDDEG